MSRLVASENALRTLVILSQRAGGDDGLRISEVADALEISYTGAQKAIDILVADGLADASSHRHAVGAGPRAQEAVRFALSRLPADVALAALARGNEAVEFAGTDDRGSIIVFRRFSEPGAEARIRAAVATLQEFSPSTRVEFVRKENLRRRLVSDLAPRRRAAGMRVLAGSVDRSFPDRTRHGDFDARPLGRLNDAIAAPAARRLRALAREYGLRRITAFGSATRSDFREDSDIDLLVEAAAGRELGLAERVGLIGDAERLFGRDVDLLIAPVRRISLAERTRRDGVVLYDA
ncbi:MAG: nucleotidyltransferase domain-containing protein, partial [Chloroflexota bacterium]